MSNTSTLNCGIQWNIHHICFEMCNAIQYNRQSNDQKFIAPWVVTSATMFPSEDEIAWHHYLIFKALDQRIQRFQLGIEYFGKLFWTMEFYRNENRGEGMNISGFSQTSPKIQFRALRSVRGRENSHISYIGDNFSRSQIAPLSSFHIYWLNNITCLENFCQYSNI